MPTTPPIQRGRRYRRLIIGLIVLAIASLLGAMLIGQDLAGLVVYAVVVLVALVLTAAFRYSGSVALQDERECRLQRRASHLTFQLFGYLGLFTFVALLLLDASGRHSLGTAQESLLYAYAAISLTWGGIYTGLRYRT